MTTETVALVGTRKGLWIGRSDERRETWTWEGPHFDMQEVYSCMVDTRGGRTRLLAGAASSWLGPQVASPTTSVPAGSTVPTAGSGSRPTPVRRSSGSGSSSPGPTTTWCGPAPSPAPCGGPTTAARRFTLERALWDHPQRPEWGAGYGGQAFHTLLPHPSDPRPDRRDLDRRRLPDRRRRRVVVAAQRGHPGRVPPRGPAVPPVRPVRAQGGPAPVAAGAAVRPEPRRCLPLRRRGRVLGLDRRRAAVRLRLPHRGRPARPRHRLRLPALRRRRSLPTRREGARAGGPATRARAGGRAASATGCRTASSSA